MDFKRKPIKTMIFIEIYIKNIGFHEKNTVFQKKMTENYDFEWKY